MSWPTVHDLVVGLGVGVAFALSVAVCVGVYLLVAVPVAWHTVRDLPPAIRDHGDPPPAGTTVPAGSRGAEVLVEGQA